MHVVVVDTYYPEVLRRHYGSHPGLEREPYERQLASLMALRFGTSNAYSAHLCALGHAAREVVANCEPLQARWAAEHGMGGRPRRRALATHVPEPARGALARRRLEALAVRQLERFDPRVVYVQNMGFFGRPALDRLRAGGRLVAGQIASPLPSDEVVRGYDLVVTSLPHFVPRVGALGVDAEYLPLAFDARVLEELGQAGPDGPRPHAVAFVGGLTRDDHSSGLGVLERIGSALDVDVWGFGAEGLDPGSPVLRRYHGEAWGLDMYRALARSRIVINRHSDYAEGHANNMRLFEATGMGALVLTEAAPNLPELFEPGREVVTYEDADDAVQVIRRLLADDDERRSVAAAGQARTFREHTYARRMAELAALLEARLD